MQPTNNTTYCLVTATSRDSTTEKWFSWTSRPVRPEDVEDTIDAHHVKQLEKNCTLEAVRVTSSSDPRFCEVWNGLVKDINISYKTKFNILASEFPNLSINVKFQTEAFTERRKDLMILHAQRMSECRALRQTMNAKTDN